MKLIIGVREWALVVGIAMPLAVWAGVSAGTYVARRPPESPPPQQPCRDEARVELGSGDHVCPPGARLEVWPMAASYWLTKCICPASSPAAVDAGGADR